MVAGSEQGAGTENGVETTGKQRILQLPNQLTILRLLLALVFFVLLSLIGQGVFGGDLLGRPGEPASSRSLVLHIANVLFVLAVSTDFLDGYLARRLGLESTFGRIADPFVDKIIICGGFILLTGISPLVKPWFPVIIVLREFLVSGLRSFLEARGVAFGASWSGKLKMIAQSIAIPAVLLHEALRGSLTAVSSELQNDLTSVVYWIALAMLALTLILTIGSCGAYLRRAAPYLRD